MFSILISEKGGETKRLDFDRPEITIGRVAGNDIVLPRGNISKRHSRIVYKDAKFIIVDLKSTNGTFVNGRKITSPLVVKGTDKIYVGDFIMTIEEGSGPSTSSTADIEGEGSRPGPPPPPPPSKSRPFVPAGRGEATSMDMPTGHAEEAAEEAASAKSPLEEPGPSRPPLPPRPGTRPPLGGPPESARATIANEVIRDAAALQRLSLNRDAEAGIDRPVLSADRISDKATMMAQEGGRAAPASPLATSPAALTPVAPVSAVSAGASATSTPASAAASASSAVTPPGGTPAAPPAPVAPPPPLPNRPALSARPAAD